MPGAIGIFDSGVGGLTVLTALRRRLPEQDFLYLGDTARLPYGSKSQTTIRRYALKATAHLIRHDVRLLVVACNTASAFALPDVVEASPVPVLGVVEPGVRAALARGARKIAVIGTEGTIRSGAYQQALHKRAPGVSVLAAPCPLFVPLAEEGMADHPATEMIAREYLTPLLDQGIDTLVLGCTHYPALRETLAAVCGPGVTIIDSATAVAAAVEQMLDAHDLRRAGGEPRYHFYGTDVGERFARVGEIFLGEPVEPVEWVDVTRSPDGHAANAPPPRG